MQAVMDSHLGDGAVLFVLFCFFDGRVQFCLHQHVHTGHQSTAEKTSGGVHEQTRHETKQYLKLLLRSIILDQFVQFLKQDK